MALTKKEISQLYVALLNRAADAGGVEHWQDQASLAEAAQAMIDSQAGTSFYPEDNRAFIDQIYENTVGLEGQEDADIQYWVDLLASGEYSRGELVAHMVNSIMDPAHEGTAFQESYLNRVAVSEYVAGLELDGELSVEELVAATTFNEAGLGVVRTEADIKSAKEKADELEAVDNTSLTEAMAALDAAKQDKADFAKELDLDGNGEADGETSATVDAAVTADYNAKAGAVGATGTGVDDGSFKDRSESVQDQLIADHKTSLNSELSKASNKVEGAADLVEAVRAEVENTEAAHKADAAATLTLSGATQAFGTVNTTNTYVFKADAAPVGGSGVTKDDLQVGSPAADLANKDVFVYDGKAYLVKDVTKGTSNKITTADLEKTDAVTLLGTKSGNTWTLTKAGKEDVNGVADVLSANDAANAAAKALADAKDALAEAVEAVYINENGGYEVKLNTGNADLYAELKAKNVIDDATTAGKYVVDYSKTVDTYDTEDDADAGLGQEQVFTYKVTAGEKTGDKLVFGDMTYTATGDVADAATVAGTIQAALDDATAGGVKWTVTVASDVLTFTAQTKSENVDDVAALLEITQVNPGGTLAGAVQAGGTDGVAPGDTDTVDAAKSGAVNKAQGDIAAFDKVVDAFLAIRDTKAELDGYNDEITEATKWFADNDYAAPVVLVDGDSKNATNKSDVFLLSDLKGSEDAAIGKFGDKGADYLFIGEGYKLVALGDKTIDKNVGIQTELEIFYKQSGNDLTLYVETEAFGGNLANQAEIVEITLVGKAIDDITLDGSFITAGDAIA